MKLKGREKQIVEERIKKINDLIKQGVNPYSHRLKGHEKKIYSKKVKEKYSKLKKEQISNDLILIAGRIMTKRSFGKLSFVQLQDLKGEIQLVFQKGKTPENALTLFKKIDSGDIVGINGNPIKTKTGEISILAKELKILTKSILPLPDKYSGLKDKDEKLRKRYLDILMNPDIKELFIKKSKFWNLIRTFLSERNFLEVETPILENSAGGATATPFKTHHNALNLDIFLRISMGELWQKKLMVAGYEKTFEIGRQFRNEGMDMEHLQDYTQMEFYWAYANYKDGMKLVEEMYKKIAKEVFKTLKFKINNYEVDFSKKWEIYDFENLIRKYSKIEIYSSNKKEIMKKLEELKIDFDSKVDKWRMIDLLWKYCRKKISGPGFLTGQPVELAPLAKRNPEDKRKVEQFQVIIAGSEMGNGYSELNDPLDQEERFKNQMKNKKAGDTEAMDHDKEFVEALKYGMPPTCGFGLSERLFSFMAGKPIRECVIFPLMKPE